MEIALQGTALRQAVLKTLRRRCFIIPSFKIYGGLPKLLDYGPPGCAVKSNITALWRQHFVLEENMLEVDCPCLTPEVVINASGSLAQNSDFTIQDEITKKIYDPYELLQNFAEEKSREGDFIIAMEARSVARILNNLTAEDLGAKIREYGITAPDTNNPLSDPVKYLTMFETSIGPSGLENGYLRPVNTLGVFLNFNDLYSYNGNKLPFAAAQIGQAFKKLMAPCEAHLRVQPYEFTSVEFYHFFDPEDESHPKFVEVAHLKIQFIWMCESQIYEDIVPLDEAVSGGIVKNQTLGYFIGRVYLFLMRIGIDKKRLHFQVLPGDWWDVYIENSRGWLLVGKIQARDAYELRVHMNKSGVSMVAYKNSAKEVDVEQHNEYQTGFTPSVIEASFCVQNIINVLFEHTFYMRLGTELHVFRLPPLVAPFLCSIFPIVRKKNYEEIVDAISKSLTSTRISHKVDITGTTIGKRYARADELGVPFAVTVDSTSSVTIRERDSKGQIRLSSEDVAQLLKDVIDGKKTWEDAKADYI